VKTNKPLSLDLNLSQTQTNLLLRALESLENEVKVEKVKDGCYELWNKIFDAGVAAGFGSRPKVRSETQVYDLWELQKE
tara:strand:- start:235 stop:471 length:237 start_codon:yes stop_codon:yes gene_type:complete